jgi:hypothetical protein
MGCEENEQINRWLTENEKGLTLTKSIKLYLFRCAQHFIHTLLQLMLLIKTPDENQVLK